MSVSLVDRINKIHQEIQEEKSTLEDLKLSLYKEDMKEQKDLQNSKMKITAKERKVRKLETEREELFKIWINDMTFMEEK